MLRCYVVVMTVKSLCRTSDTFFVYGQNFPTASNLASEKESNMRRRSVEHNVL